MKKLIGLAIASLLVFPSAAQAADWLPLGESRDGTRVLVDAGSLVRQGPIVWFWSTYDKSLPDEDGVYTLQAYNSMNCHSRVYRVRQVITRDREGRVMKSAELGDKAPLSRVVPGTLMDGLFQSVCSR